MPSEYLEFEEPIAALERKIQDFISSGIEWLPVNKIILDKDKKKSVLDFLKT